MSAFNNLSEAEAYQKLLDMEFAILDAQPRDIRDLANDVGSPVQQWLLEGHSQLSVAITLPLWAAQCLAKQRSSQPQLGA